MASQDKRRKSGEPLEEAETSAPGREVVGEIELPEGGQDEPYDDDHLDYEDPDEDDSDWGSDEDESENADPSGDESDEDESEEFDPPEEEPEDTDVPEHEPDGEAEEEPSSSSTIPPSLIIPPASNFLGWVIAQLLRVIPVYAAVVPKDVRVRTAVVGPEWRRDLSELRVGDSLCGAVEEGHNCLFLGAGEPHRFFDHESGDPRSQFEILTHILPHGDDGARKFAELLTGTQNRRIALSSFYPQCPNVSTTLDAAINGIMLLVDAGRYSWDQAETACRELMQTAYDRVLAGDANDPIDLTIPQLGLWLKHTTGKGFSNLVGTMLHRSVSTLQIDWEMAKEDIGSWKAQIMPAKYHTQVGMLDIDVLVVESCSVQLPQYVRAENIADVCVQILRPGKFIVTTRGEDVRLDRAVAAWRKAVAGSDLSDEDQDHLRDIGRPEIAGKTSPIHLVPRRQTAGNAFRSNPHIPAVDLSREEIVELLIDALKEE